MKIRYTDQVLSYLFSTDVTDDVLSYLFSPDITDQVLFFSLFSPATILEENMVPLVESQLVMPSLVREEEKTRREFISFMEIKIARIQLEKLEKMH